MTRTCVRASGRHTRVCTGADSGRRERLRSRAAPWDRADNGPRLAPRKELPDGTVWTFARDRHGRLREERGERWDVAESALVRGLEEHGFRDAFRELNGFDSKEPSWEWPRWGGGYRLDHLIASAEVEVTTCAYCHDWRREDKLSDHSALVAELSVRA